MGTIGTWRVTAAGLALVAVCYGLARFAYGLFLPAFRTDFGLSDTLLGTIAGGSFAGYCLAVVGSAAAVPRFGPRAVATTAGVIAATGMAVVAASPNGWVLAGGILLAGTSTGVASPPLAEAIARRVAPPMHDRAQAVVNAGPGAGIAVSGLVALLAMGSWRTAWSLFSVIAVTVTIWVAVTVPTQSTAGGRFGRVGDGVIAVASTVSSWRLVGSAALFGAASTAVWTFGRDHVSQANALGHTGSTLLWVTLGVAELAGLLAGDAIARWGLRHIWMLNLASLALSTTLLGLIPTVPGLAFGAVAIFGAAYVALTTVVFLWAIRLHPAHPAAAIALGFLAISAGQACVSPIVGALVEHTGATTAFIFCTTLAAIAALRPPHKDHNGHALASAARRSTAISTTTQPKENVE